jgi:uncharacterized protein YegP (UPF0339 family)
MEKLNELPRPPNFKNFIGPIGYFHLYIADDVPRYININQFGFVLRANNSNNNVPSDDSAHRDNYRVRRLPVKDCGHTNILTYSNNAPSIGVGLILNVNSYMIYTAFFERGNRYSFTNYEYLLDLRYMHSDCIYRFWANDDLGNMLMDGDFVTNFSSDMLYETVVKLNYHEWNVPKYLRYLITNSSYNIQSGDSGIVEVTNINFDITTMQMTLFSGDNMSDLQLINLSSINKVTGTIIVDGLSIVVIYNYLNNIWYLSAYTGRQTFSVNSSVARWVVYTTPVAGNGSFEFEFYNNNGYTVLSGESDYNSSINTRLISFNIQDSNITFKFNDN